MLCKWLALTSVGLLAVQEEAASQTKPGEQAIVVQVGATGNWTQQFVNPKVGAHVAVEVTPIQDRLAVEAGWTRLSVTGSTERDVDIIFKKPWSLSHNVELLAGLGPEWIHKTEDRSGTNSFGAEAVVSFLYWPSKRRSFGCFLESSYDYDFGKGRERSLGVSGGLLIKIRLPRKGQVDRR